MPIQIVVPTLGEAISEATLVDWTKNEGDPVQRGDEIAALETDKASLPLECPANGVLLSILAHSGDAVRPGQVLALVGQPEEMATLSLELADRTSTREQPIDLPPESVSIQADEAGEAASKRVDRISPAARRLASQLGVDISKVAPSKPGARITSEDVERFASQVLGSPAGKPMLPFHRIELSRIQKAVAARMVESASQIPQFSISMDADASRLQEIKNELASQGIDVRRTSKYGMDDPDRRTTASLTALLVHLTARTLRKHPLLNARFDQDAVLVYDTVNMAVAVATEGGLVAPVLHGVEKLSMRDIIQQLGELRAAARENRLSVDQVSEATFTLSNLGMHGVQQFVPLVNPPQSAILGVGTAHQVLLPAQAQGIDVHRTREESVVRRKRSTAYGDSEPANVNDPGPAYTTAWMMTLTVSADHRLLDGEAVARFLASLCEEIAVCQIKIT